MNVVAAWCQTRHMDRHPPAAPVLLEDGISRASTCTGEAGSHWADAADVDVSGSKWVYLGLLVRTEMVKSNCQGDVEFYPPENYESLALISGGPKSLKTSGLLCRLDRAGMDPQSLLKQSPDLMWNCFLYLGPRWCTTTP